VNGFSLYYEIYGEGYPLILLHGGLGVIGMFEQILPDLAATRQDYDWSADVAALKVPTLLVFADADSVRLELLSFVIYDLENGAHDEVVA
jgi:pimeloyl-ACP methyl ester carboxylesterase